MKSFLRKFGSGCWTLGFVRGGMLSLMEYDTYQVDWVEVPKDRWFADPFILDVTDDEIHLLVEDYPYTTQKGIISLLKIDCQTYKIISRKEILELPTHLSFPNIIRRDGKIYIYPESAKSGKLDVYEFDSLKEEVSYKATICNDSIWDSDITELFGRPMLFTAAHNDKQLDIYAWDDSKQRFVSKYVVPSDNKNSRLGGKIFEYKGRVYYPAQDCEGDYGAAIDIKEILFSDDQFYTTELKKIKSNHPKHRRGLHTINEYKGIVVIDVHGYRYGWIGKAISTLVNLKKRIKQFSQNNKWNK